MAIENNENWVNFIYEYKNLRELWDTKYEKYKNHSIKAAAYEKLTRVYKNIDEDATVEKVKKRIKNMRFAYKRELKRKIASERRGAGGGGKYVPNLWYFNALDFLKDYQLPEDGISMIPSSDDESVSISHMKSVKRKKSSEIYDRNDLSRKAVIHSKKSNEVKGRDEADIYGEGWAHSYRKLSDTQKLYAKKACDEIFILGQLGKLTLNSVMSEMPPYPSPVSYRSSSCNSLQPVSVTDATNIPSTPIHIKHSPSSQVNYEEVAVSSVSQYSFNGQFTDNSLS